MNILHKSAMKLAAASDGNPIISTVTVILFFIFFNLFEAMVETLIFGERFEHWLDPLFISAFIAYAAYAVHACALHNNTELRIQNIEDLERRHDHMFNELLMDTDRIKTMLRVIAAEQERRDADKSNS